MTDESLLMLAPPPSPTPTHCLPPPTLTLPLAVASLGWHPATRTGVSSWPPPCTPNISSHAGLLEEGAARGGGELRTRGCLFRRLLVFQDPPPDSSTTCPATFPSPLLSSSPLPGLPGTHLLPPPWL